MLISNVLAGDFVLVLSSNVLGSNGRPEAYMSSPLRDVLGA